MTTITHDATTLTPMLVLGYEHTRTFGNTAYDIVNQSSPDIAYEVAGLRRGTLSLLCEDLAAGLALDNLHTLTGTFDLADPDLPALDMTYVPVGEGTLALDPETRVRWIVTIDFREVS